MLAPMIRRAFLIVSLLLGFALAWAVLTGPAPKPAAAPAGEFSAGRAMADVRQIARVPHPVGSDEDAKVRDYLIGRMTQLGLSPRVQSSVQVSDKTHRPVRVDTVVAVLPGADPAASAIVVMAHYDSTPHGPGAADNAGGTASVLEIARALKTGPAPARDVAFVITDGEEAGLLGAKPFFAEDPLAKRLGFVVNMDARGSRGRAMMFETGKGNGQTIRLFARSAKRPVSDSLMVMVYELMPNFTDFTEAKQRGMQGVNFAFLGGPRDYHAASDTAANLDQRSLQDIGAQALAVTSAVAHGPLPGQARNLVYSDLLGLRIIAYPAWAGWLGIVAGFALLGVGLLQSGRVKPRDVWIGFAAALGVLVASAGLAYAAQVILSALHLHVDRQTLAIEAGGWAAGLVIFAIGAQVLGWQRGAGRWAGALVFGLVLATIAQALAPAAAPILAWPILTACLCAALTALGHRFVWLGALVAVAGLAFAASISHLAYLALLTPLGLAAWPLLAILLLAPTAWRPVRAVRA